MFLLSYYGPTELATVSKWCTFATMKLISLTQLGNSTKSIEYNSTWAKTF